MDTQTSNRLPDVQEKDTAPAVVAVPNPYARPPPAPVAVRNPYVQARNRSTVAPAAQHGPNPPPASAPAQEPVAPLPARNPFNGMMEQYRKKKKQKKSTTKETSTTPKESSGTNKKKKKMAKRKNRDNEAGTESNPATVNNKQRKKKKKTNSDGEDDEIDAEGAPAVKSTWTTKARQYLKGLLDRIKEAVYFDERGRHELKGEWPKIHYEPFISSTADPLLFCQEISKEPDELQREDFACG